MRFLAGFRVFRLALMVTMVALLAACEPGPAHDPTVLVDATLGEPFEITVGQAATIQPDQVTLTLTRIVEDSRCPANVSCVWSGQLIVEVEVAHAGQIPTTLQVNSIDNNRKSTQPNFESYTIAVVKASPSRFIENFGKPDSAIRPIGDTEYLVGFSVTRQP